MSGMVERSAPSPLRRMATVFLVLAIFVPAAPGDGYPSPGAEIWDHGDESEIPSILMLPELGPGSLLVLPLASRSFAGPARPPLRPPVA
jgi:hypothetical protein